MNLSKFFMKNKRISQPNAQYKQLDCCLVDYQFIHLKHCFILCHQPSLDVDEEQLLQFTVAESRRLSLLYTGHPDQSMLIVSGQKMR